MSKNNQILELKQTKIEQINELIQKAFEETFYHLHEQDIQSIALNDHQIFLRDRRTITENSSFSEDEKIKSLYAIAIIQLEYLSDRYSKIHGFFLKRLTDIYNGKSSN
jgi:hypothetical protein